MASHNLSNTKTTILGATPGAILGIDGRPYAEAKKPTQNPEIPKNWTFSEKFARTFPCLPVTRVRNPTEIVQKTRSDELFYFRWIFSGVDFLLWIWTISICPFTLGAFFENWGGPCAQEDRFTNEKYYAGNVRQDRFVVTAKLVLLPMLRIFWGLQGSVNVWRISRVLRKRNTL